MTAPLTPPGCDLRDFPHTPLFRSRLFGSSFHARANDSEWRAGVTLWLKSWDQVPAGSLPDDDIELCRLAEVSPRRWGRLKAAAMGGWVVCTDGRLYHPFVAEGVIVAWQAKQVRQRKVIRRLEIESEQWALLRAAVFARDLYTCVYCHASGVRLEADHVLAVARGGESVVENLVTACKTCNRSKGSKLLTQWKGQPA